MGGRNMDRRNVGGRNVKAPKMQHGHRHAVGYGHAAGTWTCNRYMDMQQGHEHAAWPWTRSMATKIVDYKIKHEDLDDDYETHL